jgi:dimethylargininase
MQIDTDRSLHGMLTRAVVRPPASNFADGLTTARLGEPDYERALGQHEAYCRALERGGLSLTRLPADSTHPDSTFVEDTAVIVKASDSSAGDANALPVEHPARDARAGTPLGRATAPPTAVLTRPGAASRLGEIESVRTALQQFFSSLQEIGAPGTIDGGDVCEAAGNHFFIGLSQRTNQAGAQQLAKMLKHLGYTSTTVDIRNVDGLLHLKSAIAYLAHNHLVVTESMADREEFANYDLVRVNSGDDYAAN